MTADIYKNLADCHYRLADLYLELAGQSATTPAPASSAPSFDELPPDVYEGDVPDELPRAVTPTGDQGSEAICPKHRKPFVEGKYGLYCTSPSDDPAWSNRKGYCNLTPKNVAQYLRVKAAA